MIRHEPAAHSKSCRRALLRTWLMWTLVLPLVASGAAVRADTAVGNGKAVSEARTTAEFSAIALKGSIALELRQGSPAAVVVHADSNLLPLLESVVDNDRTLQLRWRHGTSVHTDSRAWVEVTAPQIAAVSSAGSGDIVIDSMKLPQLSLSITGSSNVRAKALNTDDLSLGIAGSGNAHLAGRAARLALELSGSGAIDAAELRADDVRVSIAGSGSASVYAARTLVASIAGSGNVTYSGEPSVQPAIAGSGRVRRR